MPRLDRQSIVRQYLDRFPKAATRTLAQLAYRENPEVWSTAEACRCAFRYARGAKGKQLNRLSDKTHVRPVRRPHDPFGKIPEGLSELGDWSAHVIDAAGCALILADLHVPYHNTPCLELIGRAHRKPDVVIILGDLMDCFALSRWEPDPRQRDFAYEVECGRQLIEAFRGIWPKAEIVYKLGNHDERLESYLACKAPELLGVADFEMAKLLRCEQHKITVVTDKRPIKLGKMYLIHGHEYRFQISNPVNPARGLFLRGKVTAVCGHFHQTSQHSEKALDEDVISCWSLGGLCNLHPRYQPLNKWNHGFAAIDINNQGGFRVRNYRIIKGEIWD